MITYIKENNSFPTEWKRWFAWHPVYFSINEKVIARVWLEYVERRCLGYTDPPESFLIYEYRKNVNE